jgi:spore coat polysaccharide biosynthesis protein SpsF
MKTVAIIQARMGSSRLPGKVLKELCGRSVLDHVITRVKACRSLDLVVVATTPAAADDGIVAETVRCGADVFRGSEDDVLARYHGAAQQSQADIVVRVTSDCPLFDPQVLEKMLQRFHAIKSEGGSVDYMSNSLERTFPRGLDAEIFTSSALERAYREANKPYEREHVTPYLYLNPTLFVLENFRQEVDQSSHRWTLDTEEDFRLLDEIFRTLSRDGKPVTTKAVLDLMARRPELKQINAHIEQKKLQA